MPPSFACPNASVVLLCQIDEVEVGAEGAHQLEEPSGGLLFGPGEQFAIGARGRPQLNRRQPNVFDILKELGATLLAQHLPDKLAEQSHIIAQSINRLRANCHRYQYRQAGETQSAEAGVSSAAPGDQMGGFQRRAAGPPLTAGGTVAGSTALQPKRLLTNQHSFVTLTQA